MGILLLIIALDIVVMVIVMRMVWTEPPRKQPSPHPFVLEYASKAEDQADAVEVENKDETLPVAEEVMANEDPDE